MSDLFVGNAPIDIELFYTLEKNKSGVSIVKVLEEKEALKLKTDPKTKDLVKSNHFQFSLLTWAASNRLIQQATEFNHISGTQDVNWNRFRDARFKSILIGWDIKDAAGNVVPVSEAAIDQMQQSIVLALLNRYEEAISIDKDDSQKHASGG